MLDIVDDAEGGNDYDMKAMVLICDAGDNYDGDGDVGDDGGDGENVDNDYGGGVNDGDNDDDAVGDGFTVLGLDSATAPL